jgi:hypothetical protein
MPDDRNKAASVDYMVDENASPLDVPDNSTVHPARRNEDTLGGTGPTNWWRYGLVALAALVLVFLLMQVFGGTPGTDVQTGTPVAAPEQAVPVV